MHENSSQPATFLFQGDVMTEREKREARFAEKYNWDSRTPLTTLKGYELDQRIHINNMHSIGLCTNGDIREMEIELKKIQNRIGELNLQEAGIERRNAAPAGTTTFSTGAVRSSDCDNERWDLLSPIGLRRVAGTCGEGAKKYSEYNWENGMPVLTMLNHAIRHIFKYLAGDRSEDHLAHAAWNLLAACHSEELWPELNKNLRGSGCKPPVVTIPHHVGETVKVTGGMFSGRVLTIDEVHRDYIFGTSGSCTFQVDISDIESLPSEAPA